MRIFELELTAVLTQFYNVSDLTRKKFAGMYAGVYVMYNDVDEVIYVGKSIDLSVRLKGHRKDSKFFPKITRIDFYEIGGGYEREMLETYLINALRPKYNKSKTYFRSEEYGELIEESEYEIGELTTEVVDLRSEYAELTHSDYTMHDRETVRIDKQCIREEIKEKVARIKELQASKQTLIMRQI